MMLYIVRHGETIENKQMILQGHLPGNLTENGKNQIINTAKHLQETNMQYDCIISSDLKRAIESAEIISSLTAISAESAFTAASYPRSSITSMLASSKLSIPYSGRYGFIFTSAAFSFAMKESAPSISTPWLSMSARLLTSEYSFFALESSTPITMSAPSSRARATG